MVCFSSSSVDGTVEAPRGAQTLNPLEAGDQFGIFRFHRHGEAEIALGIFMAAIDFGVVRQRHQFLERSVHLFRRAFEEPAATCGEQRVAAKKIVFEKISDVPGGVAGNKKNFALELADLDFIAFFDAVASSPECAR